MNTLLKSILFRRKACCDLFSCVSKENKSKTKLCVLGGSVVNSALTSIEVFK